VLTLEEILIAPPEPGTVVDPRELLGGRPHVELEIGCGKGGFLVRQATANPDRGYLGIEWANQIVHYAADRMVRRGLANVRLMRTDARHFVTYHLALESIQALHTYHPDPWPKKRHHKRRLFQPNFVTAAIRSLAPGARWAIQTDHADYFAWIREQLAPHIGRALEPVPFDDPGFGVQADRTMGTNFEIKYLREGRTIFQVAFRRSAGSEGVPPV